MRERERELAEAQALAHLGSWNWDIATNIVTWSDEMQRIAGLTPHAFAATYEGYLERVHPDERALADASVKRAFQTGEPFTFEHRMVRPDGSVRWIHARGEVVLDASGKPCRMFGTAQDITERKQAEQAFARTEHQFQTVLRSAPDALVGVDESGRIVLVNMQTERLFGFRQEELVGAPVERLLPEHVRERHIEHRAGYMRDPRTRPMGTGLQLSARRKDGSQFPVDISLSAIETEQGRLVTAFVRDATERMRAEESARLLRDAELRRAQALEINDNVVQGIATAVYALEAGEAEPAMEALRATIDAARHMMADLLAMRTGAAPIEPGDLVREEPATALPREVLPVTPVRERQDGGFRVLVADDSADIRTLMRFVLAPHGFDVIAEAETGEDAIRLAGELLPHIVLLDLAMPVMDGLQALPEIRKRSPGSKIVMLSGYGKEQAAAQAMALGASAYVEKGGSPAELAALLRELVGTPAAAADRAPGPATLKERLDLGPNLELLLATYSHELRGLLTVIQGISETLDEKMNKLSPDIVQKLLGSLTRNARHMASLVDALSDARRVEGDTLSLTLQHTDVGELVRQTADDIEELTKGHPLRIDVTDGAAATADPMRIRQVIANLLSNAAKFSPPGEPIDVRVDVSDGTVAVSVADRGSGLPEDGADRLFHKFERLGAAQAGLGLGLYISRGIARAHGGDLVLHRTGPEGSEFRLTLPRARTS